MHVRVYVRLAGIAVQATSGAPVVNLQAFQKFLRCRTVSPVVLKCPFCDKPYRFEPDVVCICPSCDLEIIPPTPGESVPRIRCSKCIRFVLGALLIAAPV